MISSRPPLVDAAPPPHVSPTQLLGETLVGKRLEHYELIEFVGGGGMGAVFRANDTRLGRVVAVKVLSADHADEETIRRFRNEAQSAARLDHPNIARVYYVGEDHGWNFIVFEFIDGTNLRDAVEQQGQLELEQALHYVVQIAEALAHSSSRDVIHRDIKPSNVLVTTSGEVKLVDMGLARLHQVESSTDDLTASGVTLGTFDYISPEQARDPRSADVRSDIYSLGCTLFYMLTGQPPFPDGTALQKLLRHNSDEPPDVRGCRPELNPRVSVLLAKMLAKRPSQRHQSAAELVTDLVGIGQHLGLVSVAQHGHAAAIAPLGEARSSKLWQIVIASAVLLAGIVLMDALAPTRDASSEVVARPNLRPAASPVAGAAGSAPNEALPENATSTAPLESFAPSSNELAQAASSASPTPAPRDAAAASRLSAPGDDAPGISISALPAEQVTNVESSTDASAAPAVPPAAGAKPKRLLVAAAGPLVPDPDTEYAPSVAEACHRAAELGLTEVELQWNGERREQPFEIASPRLALRATAGFRPVLVFRPRVQVTDRQMIRLAGGSTSRLAIHGAELRLELPTDPPADGWALLSMSTGQTLDLTECVLTVQDGDANREPLHGQVAMIQVQRRRGETTSMMDVQLAMAQQATIGLTRSIARGEASFVSLTDETPLTITWNQGLVATSRRFIETGGSATNPQFYEQIVVDLTNVTAVCREGLYLLRRGPGKSYQFQVAARAERCVFVIDPDVPLYEMIGLTAPPADEDLQAIGESNRFSQTDVLFLRVRSAVSGELGQDFPLDQRWSKETRSQVGIPWLRPPPLDQPSHTFTRSDFALEPETGAGFDPALLPETAAPPAAGLLVPAPAVP